MTAFVPRDCCFFQPDAKSRIIEDFVGKGRKFWHVVTAISTRSTLALLGVESVLVACRLK